MAIPSFSERISHIAAAVEAELGRLLGPDPLPGEIARPARLMAAMRHGALNGGKRLRPFLLIESAALFGQAGDGVLRAACALEMAHCYSLVHDDLPAMDDDDVRRGQPTVHKAFDEATAILAGDSLLTYAFDVMADEATHPDGAVRARLVTALARAAGPGGMAGGQMLDLEAENADAPLGEEAVRQLQAMKTGALIRFAVEAGAILGGAAVRERDALVDYGRLIGAAFQIADDILDAEGDEARLGKAAGKDAGRNKATLVAVLGLKAAKGLRDDCTDRACASLAVFGERAHRLIEAARFVAARDH